MNIGVWSELGKGTTLDIYFPRVEKQEVDVPLNHVGPAKGGTETLLVVEDEVSLRRLARSILEKLGYQVLTASNGQEGLRAAREHTGPPISLVITDVIMPIMDGKVMADRLIADYPDLKILFTSGCADFAVARHGVLDVLDPEVPILLKPHTPAALARKVRELLDGPALAPCEPGEMVNGAGLSTTF